ncbi:MAG: hypothetical protein HYT72_02620 [Candidatus Aenigmarchaeota archaeon]|nr:hypothetical protein [Candidatus Aenigmarchaeota archaeon]
MKPEIMLFFASVLLFPVLFITGLQMFFIYLLVWADKIILGLFRPFRYFGVELTTLAAVLAAIFYGPFVSFVLVLFLFTFLQSLRYTVFPVSVPEYPLFVPNPDGVIYALGGIIAGFMLPFGFGATVIVVVITKYIMYIVMDMFLRKPPPVMGLIGGIAFHVAIIIPSGLALMKILA